MKHNHGVCLNFPGYSHHPHQQNIPYRPAWLLFLDCLTLNIKTLGSLATSAIIYSVTQRNIQNDLIFCHTYDSKMTNLNMNLNPALSDCFLLHLTMCYQLPKSYSNKIKLASIVVTHLTHAQELPSMNPVQ